MFAPNIIIPYDGTHASIPAGWIRFTDLDSKFPKGASSGWGDSGGNATHTHTSSAHSHTLNSHTHTGTSGLPVSPHNFMTKTGTGGTATSHRHNYTTGASSGGTSTNVAATIGTSSNNPPYYTVIFIKSTGYSAKIPENGIVFRNDSGRTGLTYHSASEDKYLMGAGTSANAGSTGGSLTDSHSISSTHSSSAHSHSNVTSGISTVFCYGSGSGNTNAPTHTHPTVISNQTANVTTYSTTHTPADNTEPEYAKVRHYYASSAIVVGIGDIAMTTEATTPNNWIDCDGTNDTPDLNSYFIKNVDATYDTSGSNTHTHSNLAHGHTSTAHYHSVSLGSGGGNNVDHSDSGAIPIEDAHTHSSANSNTTVGAYANSNIDFPTSNNEPAYIKVNFIQLNKLSLGGAMLMSKLM